MAQRRMVSVKIIDSAKFIKMPVSTQALYFHLIARADDDGIVEAFNVMRMTGASEDDLKVLCAKEFVKVLNEDMVAFITDWHEHNLIRSDRKIDSMYQHLLLQVVPEVELKEKKERADRRKLLMDNHGTSHGQPKDSIVEVRLGNGSEVKKKQKQVLSANVESFFETCWDMMPSKKGKGRVSNDSKTKAFNMGDIFIECIKAFNKDMKSREPQYIPHGSTFFNSGYVDYVKTAENKKPHQKVEFIRVEVTE